jgi:hypothetical protein
MVPTNTNVTAEEPEMGTRCENNALKFNYDYRNTSCDEEYEVWSASKFIPAASGLWMSAIPGVRYFSGYPSNFNEPCRPNII